MEKILEFIEEYIFELPFVLTENSNLKLIRILGMLWAFVYCPIVLLVFGVPYLLLLFISILIDA